MCVSGHYAPQLLSSCVIIRHVFVLGQCSMVTIGGCGSILRALGVSQILVFVATEPSIVTYTECLCNGACTMQNWRASISRLTAAWGWRGRVSARQRRRHGERRDGWRWWWSHALAAFRYMPRDRRRTPPQRRRRRRTETQERLPLPQLLPLPPLPIPPPRRRPIS
jgi:hypothetical protein